MNALSTPITEIKLPKDLDWAIDEYVPALGDWLNTERAKQMAGLILDTKPELVVEIGTFMGQSLLPQAFALRQNGTGVIIGIDPYELDTAIEGNNDHENNVWWQSLNLEDIYLKVQKLIRADHHLERWACLLRARSQDVAHIFGKIDILFIDGNHSEESSTRDVLNYLPLVKLGGYIWADDCDWPTTQKAYKMLDDVCDKIHDWGNDRLYQKMLHFEP